MFHIARVRKLKTIFELDSTVICLNHSLSHEEIEIEAIVSQSINCQQPILLNCTANRVTGFRFKSPLKTTFYFRVILAGGPDAMERITHIGMVTRVSMIPVVLAMKTTLVLGNFTLFTMNTCYQFLFSLVGAEIECNCDDDKTGITDNNLLKSKDQLPVKGKILYLNSL